MKYTALVGEIPEQAIEKLQVQPDISKVIRLPRDSAVESPIGSHPDTILCVFNNILYCHKQYAENNKSLLTDICKMCGLSLCPQDAERSGSYPHDCAFNALIAGNYLIGKKKSLCTPLSEICINTNQGYAACCALYAGGTVITADPSITKACKDSDIPVFSISGNGIILPGYNKGFIGGAGGFCNNKIYLFGDLVNTPVGEELSDFCLEKGFELVSLCNGQITDYGGIKFLPIA